MYSLRALHDMFETYWRKTLEDSLPTLYEPAQYLMELGGKRLRPILLLAACDAMEGNVDKALPAATAVEFFHTFTLMHDDIMDNAPLRRGKPTVHKKYSANSAILSGDALFAKSYELLLQIEDVDITALLKLFTATTLEVCDGQQLDMDYEKADHISVEQYLEMIQLKTAVLPACALQMGAIIAKSQQHIEDTLYQFGMNMGMAFQLKDDILDVYGEHAKVGKQVGGDIVQNKKTILLTLAQSHKSQEDKTDESLNLDKWLNYDGSAETKVAAVKAIYDKRDVFADATVLENEYHNMAMHELEHLAIEESQKEILYEIAGMLLGRDS